jgi:hypothetical protein
VNVNVHESVEHWFHELVVKGRQNVVVQFDPLKTVKVLESCRWDVFDPKKYILIKIVYQCQNHIKLLKT